MYPTLDRPSNSSTSSSPPTRTQTPMNKMNQSIPSLISLNLPSPAVGKGTAQFQPQQQQQQPQQQQQQSHPGQPQRLPSLTSIDPTQKVPEQQQIPTPTLPPVNGGGFTFETQFPVQRASVPGPGQAMTMNMEQVPPKTQSLPLLYHNVMPVGRGQFAPVATYGTTYYGINPGASEPAKRKRKKSHEVERLYHCNYKDCKKAYGTLNHLNSHVILQNHGQKRLPAEFKELREELKRRRKAEKAKMRLMTKSTNVNSSGELGATAGLQLDPNQFKQDPSTSPSDTITALSYTTGNPGYPQGYYPSPSPPLQQQQFMQPIYRTDYQQQRQPSPPLSNTSQANPCVNGYITRYQVPAQQIRPLGLNDAAMNTSFSFFSANDSKLRGQQV